MNQLADILAHTTPQIEEFLPALDPTENFLVGGVHPNGEIQEAPVSQARIRELLHCQHSCALVAQRVPKLTTVNASSLTRLI
jgi:hypothetical protein